MQVALLMRDDNRGDRAKTAIYTDFHALASAS